MAWQRQATLAIALGALAGWIYWTAPNRFVADSHYSMLLAYNILEYGTTRLDRYFVRPLDPQVYPGVARESGYPYMVKEFDGHIYYFYPIGGSLSSLPLVAYLNTIGIRPISSSGLYNSSGEQYIESIVATIMSALSVTIISLYILKYHSWLSGGLVALAVAFGTPLLSTTSRVMWSNTPLVLIWSIVILLLVRLPRRPTWRSGLVLGLLAGAGFYCRPSGAVMIGVVGIYLAFAAARALPWYALASLLSVIPLGLHTRAYTGSWLPEYYALTMTGPWPSAGDAFNALLGILVSPSRGLVVFVPTLVFVGYCLLRYWRDVPSRGLVLACCGVSAAEILGLARWPDWAGGSSYGPRLLSDLVPCFALIGAAAVRAWLDQPDWVAAGRRHFTATTELVCALLLMSASMFIHFRGATSPAALKWNEGLGAKTNSSLPYIWDWSRAQFLAGLGPAAEIGGTSPGPAPGAAHPLDLLQLQRSTYPARLSLDQVGRFRSPLPGSRLPVQRRGGDTIPVAGWAVDVIRNSPALGVAVELGGRRLQWARVGILRDDVLRLLQDPRLNAAGFEVNLKISDLEPGLQSVRAIAIGSTGSDFYVFDNDISLVVE